MIKFAKWCLFALALIPFMIAYGTFFPYSTGQSLYARGLLSVVGIVFAICIFSIPEFKREVISKSKNIAKNPVFISVSSFVLIFMVSTIFAVNKYSALWGTLDRAEGLIGMLFFYSAFIFTLFIFEKKDWITFFKVNLLVSLVLGSRELFQFASGVNRPSSFLDNPTFLAGYFLFSILCAFIVFSESKDKFWKITSIGVFLLSILGIFFTETRSTILGLIAGFLLVLVYGIVKGKNVFYRKINLKKASIFISIIFVVFSFIFITTRTSSVWQKVPGLGRVANISSIDSTTQTRLIALDLSLKAVNPANNGIKKFIIGWGPENFSLAYGQYFNPKQFDYEMRWFDRSHNKLADTFVMNGLVGLLAYLVLYFYLFRSIFKREDFSITNIGILFFGASLFIHLLFVFDQITTSIPFFVVLSFVVFLSAQKGAENKSKIENNNNLSNNYYPEIIFATASIFLVFLFIRNDVLGYIQMKKYMNLRENPDTSFVLKNINSVFFAPTIAHAYILKSFLVITENPSDPAMLELSNIAISKSEDYMKNNPFDLKFYIELATAYTKNGKFLKNQDYLDRGEYYFRKMLFYSPNRPDSNMGLALGLFYQKKYDESFVYFERALELNNYYFIEQSKTVTDTYPTLFQYFYNKKDKVNFLRVSKRLLDVGYITEGVYNQLDLSLNKYNTWPPINFQ